MDWIEQKDHGRERTGSWVQISVDGSVEICSYPFNCVILKFWYIKYGLYCIWYISRLRRSERGAWRLSLTADRRRKSTKVIRWLSKDQTRWGRRGRLRSGWRNNARWCSRGRSRRSFDICWKWGSRGGRCSTSACLPSRAVLQPFFVLATSPGEFFGVAFHWSIVPCCCHEHSKRNLKAWFWKPSSVKLT